ncbi:MAG: hypothetical protein QUS13_03340 [Smithella sp.]|nr:hypothetical protein [Smithella sp.]
MKKWKRGFLIVCYFSIFCFLLVMSGCVSREAYLQKSSAGQVGCPANSITIEDIETMLGTVSGWTAKCEGKTFICSSMTSGIVCKESLKKGKTSSKK